MTQKYQVKVSMKQAAIVETGIVLKQGDFGMQIEIEVLDFDATGTTPQIVFRKAMGAVESTTITVSSNKYTYTFKGTELDTPGKVFCDLKLKNSTTQRISTASFMFKVVADTLDGLAEESSSYSDTIEQLLANTLQKSETVGLVKNDGTIDTNIYALSSRVEALASNVEEMDDNIGKLSVDMKRFSGLSTNEIYAIESENVSGTGTYIYKDFVINNISPNTLYTLYCESISGATATNPIVIYVKNSSDQNVQSVVSTASKYANIVVPFTTAATADHLVLRLYASTSGAVTATYNDVRIFKGVVQYDTVTEEFKQYITTIGNYAGGNLNKDVFVNGGLGNGQVTAEKFRVTSSFKFLFPFDIVLSIDTNFKYGVYNASSGTTTPWMTEDYPISANTPFMVVVARVTEDQSETADIGTFVSKLKVRSSSNDKVKEALADISTIGPQISAINTEVDAIDGFINKNFVVAPTFSHSTKTEILNEHQANNYPLRYAADAISIKTDGTAFCGVALNVYNLIPGNNLSVKSTRSAGNNNTLRIKFNNKSGQQIEAYISSSNSIERIIPAGTEYAEVLLVACWGTALADQTAVTFSNVEITSVYFAEEGEYLYTGDKITISNNNTQKHKCIQTQWKDFRGDSIPDIAGYKFHLNQSMAIYNGFIFLFQDDGSGVVLNYSDKSIYAQFSFTPDTSNHANSAQFMDIFYDNGDDYPLLMLSRCGNSAGGTGYDECLIYRIQQSGTTFTFTNINSISFNKTTYGADWGIDKANRKIYCMSLVGGIWSVTTNNPVGYWGFNLPTRESIISGEPITLDADDVISYIEFEHFIPQAMYVDGESIYQALQLTDSTPYVYIIKASENKIAAKIPLAVANKEPEGVAIYDGKMYVTHRTSEDTTGTNPLKLYELDFQ